MNGGNPTSLQSEFLIALNRFKRSAKLTTKEEDDFRMTSLEDLRDCIRTIQRDQEQNKKLMYMKRLDPFLQTMEQYGKVLDVFVNTSEVVAFIWVTRTFSDALHCVLDAYQDIGEQIPLLEGYQNFFTSNGYMRTVLIQIYEDILEFHREAIKHFKQKLWKQLFQATWRGFTVKIQHIRDNLKRHRHLIESHATIVEFAEIQRLRDVAKLELEAHMSDEIYRRQQRVAQWLSPFGVDDLQDQYREIRSICADAGRWLLDNSRFQNWINPNQCLQPLLWINGIPGAGKTILTSVVVDEVRAMTKSSCGFFYCKHGNPSRNTFIGVARSLLAQLLVQNSHLLQLLYEKASMCGEIELTSKVTAKDLLRTSLNSCGVVYIILDGLDECDREQRREITAWFRSVIDELPPKDIGTIRCLFVSQDDGVGRKEMDHIPSIKIMPSDNKGDIRAFANVWHKRMEDKFGTLQGNAHITNIILARAQGMFLFAKLLAEFLFSQPSKESLFHELDPSILPVRLDDAYARIVHRIAENNPHILVDKIGNVLGWIACAPRPLRWREIQAAICLDIENQEVNHQKRLSDSPKDLFASIVELQPDGTIDLVHSTAREYLSRSGVIALNKAHFSLAIASIGFFGFPEVDAIRAEEDVKNDILEGRFAFYDYASACWSFHLQAGLPPHNESENLALLIETLEAFVELHWSKSSKPLVVSKTTHDNLSVLSSSDSYDRIAQAVGWSKRQSGRNGLGPTEGEALDLHQVTSKLRAVLEGLDSLLSRDEKKKLHQYYGAKWFKCPRINCFFYHEGFKTSGERDNHMSRHERPFMCIVDGCHMAKFGCVTENALKTHLFEFHGIDLLDDTEFPEPKRPTISSSKREATYACHLCPKKFTRSFNLRSHLRTHNDEKPFICSTCEERFTRQSDCSRHERGHGEKKFKCSGQLEDGTQWGCKAAFGRADKLASHLRSKTGQRCIRPLIIQELQNGRESKEGDEFLADQLDLDADALLSASKGLPTFAEFLQLCGIDKSTLKLNDLKELDDSEDDSNANSGT